MKMTIDRMFIKEFFRFFVAVKKKKKKKKINFGVGGGRLKMKRGKGWGEKEKGRIESCCRVVPLEESFSICDILLASVFDSDIPMAKREKFIQQHPCSIYIFDLCQK